jgi:hypothetical protein
MKDGTTRDIDLLDFFVRCDQRISTGQPARKKPIMGFSH